MLVDDVNFDRVRKLGGKALQQRQEDLARRYPVLP